MIAEKEKKAPPPLLKCRVCGLGFAREKQVANVQKKLNMPQELAETCPRCRRAAFGEEIAKSLNLGEAAGKSSEETT